MCLFILEWIKNDPCQKMDRQFEPGTAENSKIRHEKNRRPGRLLPSPLSPKPKGRGDDHSSHSWNSCCGKSIGQRRSKLFAPLLRAGLQTPSSFLAGIRRFLHLVLVFMQKQPFSLGTRTRRRSWHKMTYSTKNTSIYGHEYNPSITRTT
jgi:hypothetical protein